MIIKLLQIIFVAFSSIYFTPTAFAEKGPLIAIDIGHCAKRPGATSARGTPEYVFNLKMAETLNRELLSTKGWSTILLKDKNCLSLSQRSSLASKQNADIFVSIHHNSVLMKYMNHWKYRGRKLLYCDKFPGYSVYYSSLNRQTHESQRLAEVISVELSNAGFSPHQHPLDEQEQKRISLINAKTGLYKFDELGVLKGATMPAVLIECGMIVDRNEEFELLKLENTKKIANAIRRGIDHYWKYYKK